MSKNDKKLLETLNLPYDLHSLCKQDMEILAQEIRDLLMEIGDKIGGHLASNLGVVELTLALHAVFDSPKDRFFWDVSHQCYVHKILTGRLDRIFTLKQYGGLSGFAKISESPHDAFGAGHASTALSAALGCAHARDIQNKDHHVVSIVGDASLSGGMSYEALNNIEKMKKNFICILNDNDMSISPPVGGMANYITSIRTSKVYNFTRDKFERVFDTIPAIGTPMKRKIEKIVDRMRSTVIDTKMGVIFEELGFKYLGPIDGHNLSVVMAALKYAKSHPGPVMIHLITKKGKGYLPAEQDPVTYHGVSPKKKKSATDITLPSYTSIFGKTLVDLAKKNKNIVAITPAMREGSGLQAFSTEFPDRYFDVGIAEEHAVTFAAGLALDGLKPVLAIYSTFLQRGFDQLIHDVCLQKLSMVIAIDRAGLVGADGPTHHGVFDYSYLLLIPNMTILAPKDGVELTAMMEWATASDLIVSIRYPRGSVPEKNGMIATPIVEAKAELMYETPKTETFDVLLIAAGSFSWAAYELHQAIEAKGLSCAVINLRFIKPLDRELISSYVMKSKHTFVLEEGSKIGGVHAYILQELSHLDISLSHFHSLSLPDIFAEHGSVDQLKHDAGLSPDQILKTVLSVSLNPSTSANNIKPTAANPLA